MPWGRAGGSLARHPSIAAVSTFAAIGVGVLLPELLFGLSRSDSYSYNLVWGEQFVRAFHDGVFYPRWLPDSWDGLGSPTFYFYPPLFFWVTGAWGILPIGWENAVSLSSASFLGASGVSMFFWLRNLRGPKASFFGAMAYMLAPYHLIDIYTRGALAEATVYATLPIVMLGLRRLAENRASGLPIATLGFAGMVLGHGPATLLASITVIVPYGLFLALTGEGDGRRRIGRLILPAVIGILLAAMFLLPMATLLHHVSADQLFTPYFMPRNWSFFSSPNSIFADQISTQQLAYVLIASAFFMIGIIAAVRSREMLIRLLACCAIFCFVLVSGIIPAIWDLPLLMNVQFPSRVFLPAEFLAVTLATATWREVRGPAFAIIAVLLVGGYGFSAPYAWHHVALARVSESEGSARIRTELREAPEYLPHESVIAFDPLGRANPATITLPLKDFPRFDPVLANEPHFRQGRRGSMFLAFTVDGPTRIVFRRFSFPGWLIFDSRTGQHYPALREGPLLAVDVPAGRHDLMIARGAAPFESMGYVISAMALIMLIILTWWLRPAEAGGKSS